jgi:hypothetical protein
MMEIMASIYVSYIFMLQVSLLMLQHYASIHFDYRAITDLNSVYFLNCSQVR